MASVNKVILVGNLGKDPEVRHVMENVAVATFSIATTESYKDKNGDWQDVTDWHNVVAWRGLAERAEKFFKKGTQIYLEGKLRTRSYDDKDGNKRYVTEVVADQVFSLGKREGAGADFVPSGYEKYAGASAAPQASGSNEPAPAGADNIKIDDDLPF